MERTRKPQIAYLDTHILLWLYDGLVELLSAKAREAIEIHPLFFSPISELELNFLHEIGRLGPKPTKIIQTLAREIGLKRGDIPFDRIIELSNQQLWTRDPFDRILVGETLAANAILITKDRKILQHFDQALF